METREAARTVGFVGGALYLVDALLAALAPTVAALSHPSEQLANGVVGLPIVEFVIGVLVLLITYWAGEPYRRFAFPGGLILIVIAIVAWFEAGPGGFLGIIAAILTFIAGVLFLAPPVPPRTRA